MPNELSTLLNSLQSGFSAIQNGFDEYQKSCFIERSGEFFCLELNGEAGELANLEKKLWKGKTIAHEKLADEAADVFIALCNYANARTINLSEAISAKLMKIEERRQESEKNNEAY